MRDALQQGTLTEMNQQMINARLLPSMLPNAETQPVRLSPEIRTSYIQNALQSNLIKDDIERNYEHAALADSPEVIEAIQAALLAKQNIPQ